MHNIFTYNSVKTTLTSEAYYWESNFELIERVITASEVLIAYPKNLYNNSVKEKSILFFLRNCICNLIFENGKSYKLVTFNPEKITSIIIDIKGSDNVTLIVKFPDEEIVLSSSDGLNRYPNHKYVEILLEIAKLYSI